VKLWESVFLKRPMMTESRKTIAVAGTSQSGTFPDLETTNKEEFSCFTYSLA
jgi:hypothetical protein